MPLLATILLVLLGAGFLSYLWRKLPIEDPYKDIGAAVILFLAVVYVITTVFHIPLRLP